VTQELGGEQAEQLDVLAQLSDQMERLTQRPHTNPLGIDADDVEEYIRQIARSKE
jgi:hypothetical protein